MAQIVSLDDHRKAPQRGGNKKGTRRSFGSLRKLPSGNWQASYLGPDGVRHNAPTTFQTKKDAEAWLSMESAALTESRWKPPAPVVEKPTETLAQYANWWLSQRSIPGKLGRRKALTPRTQAEYRRVLKSFTEAPLGALTLDLVTSEAVEAWYGDLDASKPTAQAHAYALLKTVLQDVVKDKKRPLSTNPATIDGAGTAKSSKPIRPATLSELKTIADAMPPRYRAAVHLAAWCALRFGELTELRQHDVQLVTDPKAPSGVIRVRRGVTWVKDDDNKAVAVVGEPKSEAGVRDVTIPPHLVPLVADHIATHAQPGPEGLLFPNTDGNHMHHGSLYKVFRPARRAAGRPDLRWHDLRHTGATMAAQAGATTRELMDRLGHSTAGVAMRYQHVADGRAAELARKLSAMAEGLEP